MDEEFDVDSTSIVEIDGSDTSPTFFDGMEDPVLDKNCPEIDQIGCFIDYYVKCSTCSANKQTLLDKNNKQIFVMLSCFAFDSVSSTKSTTNPPEIWLLAVAAFQKAIDTIFMSEEYNTLFLSKFPTKTWPTAFTTYLENLQDLDNPSEKWIQCNAKGYRQADPAIIRKLYYGYKIIAIAKKASKDIKLHYNRRYKHPHELNTELNMSSMFRGIKWCLFKQNSQRLAVKAVEKLEARRKLSGKSLLLTEKRACIVDRVNRDVKTYDAECFWPEYWLAFLLCGLPINDFLTTKRLGLTFLATNMNKVDPETVAAIFKKARHEEGKISAVASSIETACTTPVEVLVNNSCSSAGNFSSSASVTLKRVINLVAEANPTVCDTAKALTASTSPVVDSNPISTSRNSSSSAISTFPNFTKRDMDLVAIDIAQASAHRAFLMDYRAFLMDEVARVGTSSTADKELIEELNTELNGVSHQLRLLFKRQQSYSAFGNMADEGIKKDSLAQIPSKTSTVEVVST